MDRGKDRAHLLRRLPRGAYWVLGAAVAFAGAYVAKGLADQVPFVDRVPYWLGGSAIIFIGLWIVTLGTRSRMGRNGKNRDR